MTIRGSIGDVSGTEGLYIGVNAFHFSLVEVMTHVINTCHGPSGWGST